MSFGGTAAAQGKLVLVLGDFGAKTDQIMEINCLMSYLLDKSNHRFVEQKASQRDTVLILNGVGAEKAQRIEINP